MAGRKEEAGWAESDAGEVRSDNWEQRRCDR